MIYFKKYIDYLFNNLYIFFYMGKIIGKFSLIIFVNLFAFLSVWYIVDEFLGTGAKFKIIFLVLSVVSLVLISKNFFTKALVDIEKISPNIDTITKNNVTK